MIQLIFFSIWLLIDANERLIANWIILVTDIKIVKNDIIILYTYILKHWPIKLYNFIYIICYIYIDIYYIIKIILLYIAPFYAFYIFFFFHLILLKIYKSTYLICHLIFHV